MKKHNWTNQIHFLLGISFSITQTNAEYVFKPCDWIRSTIQATYYSATKFDSNYVIVGDSGIIETTKDFNTFEKQISGVKTTLRGIANSKKNLVIVGDSGVVLTSQNAITWEKQSFNTKISLKGVVWAESLFVAIGDSLLFLSKNGIDWKQCNINGTTWKDISWNGKQLFLLESSHGYRIIDVFDLTSDSVILDTVLKNGSIYEDTPFSLAVTDTFLTFLSSPAISVHTPVNEIYYSTHIATGSLKDVMEGGGYIFGVYIPTCYKKILHIDSEYVIIGADKSFATSTDANVWKLRSLKGATLRGIVWNGTQFVAIGDFGSIITSNDGINWTRVDSTVNVNGVSRSGNNVSVTGSGKKITKNGTTWFENHSDTLKEITVKESLYCFYMGGEINYMNSVGEFIYDTVSSDNLKIGVGTCGYIFTQLIKSTGAIKTREVLKYFDLCYLYNQNSLNIHLGELVNGITQVNIYDLSGKSIKKLRYSLSPIKNLKIPLENISGGIYTVEIVTDEKHFFERVAIQR